MPSGIAAAKTGEAGLGFLPVFESPPPLPQRRETWRPAEEQAGSGRGGARQTGEAGAARSGAADLPLHHATRPPGHPPSTRPGSPAHRPRHPATSIR